MFYQRKFINIFHQLSKKEKRLLLNLFFFTLIKTSIDLISFLPVIPFMYFISDLSTAMENPHIKLIYNYLNLTEVSEFVLIVGGLIVTVFALSNIVYIYLLHKTLRIPDLLNRNIKYMILRYYLKKPFSFFKSNKTTNIAGSINFKVDAFTGGFLTPLTLIFSNLFILFVISVLSIFSKFYDFFFIFGTILLLYFIIAIFLRFTFSLPNSKTLKLNSFYNLLYEAIKGIKEIKLNRLESQMLTLLEGSSQEYLLSNSKLRFKSEFPRYLIEIFSIGGTLSIIIFLYLQGKDFNEIIPYATFCIIVSYRLVPLFHTSFQAILLVNENQSYANEVIKQIQDIKKINSEKEQTKPELNKFRNWNKFSLKIKNFSYSDEEHTILNNITLDIRRGEKILLTGKTGCGKTTLIDFIAGILLPQKNINCYIDDQILSKSDIISWQNNITYVSQTTFFFNTSILENITLNFQNDQIDHEKLNLALKTSCLNEKLNNKAHLSLDYIVGENGANLSFGEKQLLAIARSLYHSKDILIMDEATSSLDLELEKKVLSQISETNLYSTYIFVTHRIMPPKNITSTYVLSDKTLNRCELSLENLLNV